MARLILAETKKAIKGFVDLKVEIVWKGNPISCVKTFGTKNCKLCTKERLEIVKMCKYQPEKIINKCNEVYGACRHKPRFHRFPKQKLPASTDESAMDEKGKKPNSKSKKSTPSYTYEDSETIMCSDVGKLFLIQEPKKKKENKNKNPKQPTRYSERIASRLGKTRVKSSTPAS